MNTKTNETYPALTNREADYLNSLRDASANYSRALASLATDVKREEERLGNGYHTMGLGHQTLIEAATMQATLKAVLNGQYAAKEMEDREAWEAVVQQAYQNKVRWFMATEA